MQAKAELAQARSYLRVTDVASYTHQQLSHSGHESSVTAIEQRLLEADLAGPTATCTLAQVCWTGKDGVDAKTTVTHSGLAVSGIRVARGRAAFTSKSANGLVALAPTAAPSTNGRAPQSGRAMQECFVVDEQARRLTDMYLRDAAKRSARTKRARETSAQSYESSTSTLCGRQGSAKSIGRSVPPVVCRHREVRGLRAHLRCRAEMSTSQSHVAFRTRMCKSQNLQHRLDLFSTVTLKSRGISLR